MAWSRAQRPIEPKPDRRDFLSGGWRARTGHAGDAVPEMALSEIASILVQVKPEHLAAAADAILAQPGTEIHERDAKGKLVVVIEAADVGSVGRILNTISALPNVLTATLVFHATEES